jgi:hypothetical protein
LAKAAPERLDVIVDYVGGEHLGTTTGALRDRAGGALSVRSASTTR